MLKKIVFIVTVMSIISCNNKKESNITPKLEWELSESLYMNKPQNEDGNIIQTYIDTTIQNTSKVALSESLKEYYADYGFVVVMETKTGKIKTIVGLEKNGGLNYKLSKSIHINTPIEPGSLMKTFDMMSLLEDVKSDTSSVYDANGGKMSYYGQNIIDGHLGFNKLSLRKSFLYSSNTVFAKAIDSAYRKTPNQYIENFKKFGLGLSYSQICCTPSIPSPNSKTWVKTTLPWMAFGYGLKLSPLQLLTFYNSIANNGVMVEPLFLSHIQTKDGEIKKYSKPITVESWYSKTWGDPLHSIKTNKILQDLLREVVTEGSCQVVNSQKTSISGYSATTQINYSGENQKKQYASSFVGYFPSEKPKYTILVYVKNPNIEKGYYGSIVAGSVVKRIAETIK